MLTVADHTLSVGAETDGWTFTLARGGVPLGAISLTRMQLAKLVRHGKAYAQDGLELRGLRHETEIRLQGRVVGRVRHAELMMEVATAES